MNFESKQPDCSGEKERDSRPAPQSRFPEDPCQDEPRAEKRPKQNKSKLLRHRLRKSQNMPAPAEVPKFQGHGSQRVSVSCHSDRNVRVSFLRPQVSKHPCRKPPANHEACNQDGVGQEADIPEERRCWNVEEGKPHGRSQQEHDSGPPPRFCLSHEPIQNQACGIDGPEKQERQLLRCPRLESWNSRTGKVIPQLQR